jgi:Zn-dependent protease
MPRSFVACPGCGSLVHSEELKALAAQAQTAEGAGDLAAALAGWRSALALLPPGSDQARIVTATVQRLAAVAPPPPPVAPAAASQPQGRQGAAAAKWLAGLGAVGLLLAKFKWVLLFLLGKGKLLLAGLLQAKTFLSMGAALGVYALAYGWRFALGLVVSIYIHEMGHVAWLRRYGIAATAPMFIPGLGAYIRLKEHPQTVGQDARVGLAGPIWGAVAAVGFLVAGIAGGWPSMIAVGRVGAWINLFNLLPIWQLDGGRAFGALSRRQRGWTAATLWGLALVSGDGMMFLLAVVATLRALGQNAPAKGDPGVFLTYVALAAGLTLLVVKAAALIPQP